VYLAINQHVRVPQKFEVPSSSTDVDDDIAPSLWPCDLAGVRLGGKVQKIRQAYKANRLSAAGVAYLEGIDFVWDVKVWQWERTFGALRQYYAVHGDCDVPQSFKVPSEAPWPTELWGMKLGNAVIHVRHREDYIKDNPERIELLRARGLRFKTFA
jgi:hypothetical protein